MCFVFSLTHVVYFFLISINSSGTFYIYVDLHGRCGTSHRRRRGVSVYALQIILNSCLERLLPSCIDKRYARIFESSNEYLKLFKEEGKKWHIILIIIYNIWLYFVQPNIGNWELGEFYNYGKLYVRSDWILMSFFKFFNKSDLKQLLCFFLHIYIVWQSNFSEKPLPTFCSSSYSTTFRQVWCGLCVD